LQTNGSGALSWATSSGGASNVTGLSDALVESNSIYVGNDPSSTSDNASYNIAVGTTALDAITTGDNNVALGYDALTANTTGYENSASGVESLYNNTSGRSNTAMGYRSLRANTSGGYNTASGVESMYSNTTGQYNLALGVKSLRKNTTASYNTALGYAALYDANRTADGNAYNTALGYNAGNTGTNDITTGDQNVLLGASTAASQAAASNQIVIGYGATGTGNNSVSLGNTSVSSIKGQVAFTTYSDKRIKKNIVDNELGLSFINKLRTVTYNLKNPADYPEALLEKRFKTGDESRPTDNTKTQDGLIAQEVKAVLDELGVEWSGWSKNDSDGKQGIQYGALTVPLIKAMQEQQAQITELQNKINAIMEMQASASASKSYGEGDQ